MRGALDGKMKHEFVDGSILVPDDHFNPLFHSWNGFNMLIHSWLLNSFSESTAQYIVFMENVGNVWNDQKEIFSQGDLIHVSK